MDAPADVAATRLMLLFLLLEPELGVTTAYLGELPAHPMIETDTVIVATLDHEGAWRDAHGHLSIVELHAVAADRV